MKTSCNECGSSDAREVYEDHEYCFSCQKYFKKGNEVSYDRLSTPDIYTTSSLEERTGYRSYPITSRGISKEVVDYFGITMEVSQDGKPIAHNYPYQKDGSTVAYKIRRLPKDFSIIGEFKGVQLFGQTQAQGNRTLVITEGELDACAVAEAMLQTHKRIYPVVSIPSATNLRVVLEQRDWINSFKEVILMLDNDKAGKKAVDDVAKMITAGKVRVATLKEKDPCDTLTKHGARSITQAIYDAKPWNPAGIVVGEEVWDQFLARQAVESVPYPPCLDGLNTKLKGIRQGEITLFTSGTGSGKSTVIKEIVLDLLSKTDDKVGLISLEESIGDTAEKFISMALKRNIMDPPPASDEELRSGFDKVFSDERLVLLDHQGSVGDSSLVDKIEYMALMGCKYLVLDHITIAVSEGSEGLSGNEAVDKVMSDLLKVVKRHNVWLGLISHLRKAYGGTSFEEGKLASIDDIKGSGSIKQISFDIIAFARNLVAEDTTDRNTIKFRVLKSRFTGLTGDAGTAMYCTRTTRLRSAADEAFEI